jgi:hypothetical protein
MTGILYVIALCLLLLFHPARHLLLSLLISNPSQSLFYRLIKLQRKGVIGITLQPFIRLVDAGALRDFWLHQRFLRPLLFRDLGVEHIVALSIR